MKKHLAIFLIMLMAVSAVSAAGVVSAKKAVAQVPSQMSFIDVPYVSGKTYTFTPDTFNLYGTGSDVIGTPKYSERSEGGTAAVALKTTDTQAVLVYAYLGTEWKLNGIADEDTGKPCTITMNVRYHLFAKGDADTRATFSLSNRLRQNYQYVEAEVSGDSKVPVQTDITSFTFTGTVSDFFYKYSENDVRGFATASAAATSDVLWEPAAAHAMASVYLSSIVLTFG